MSHKAFHQDIINNRDDDAPRLIYADWLEENGEALWADFIRTQCHLAASTPDSDQYVDLLERQTELECLVPSKSILPVPKLPKRQPGVDQAEWESPRRGFHEKLSLEMKYSHNSRQRDKPEAIVHLCEQLRDIFASTPLQALAISNMGPTQSETLLLKEDILQNCTSLDFRSDHSEAYDEPTYPIWADQEAEMIAASPHLQNLRHLDLSAPITDHGLLALGEATNLPRLESLVIELHECTAQGVADFVASPLAQRLRGLSFLHGGVNDAVIIALANGPVLPQLRTLDFAHNAVEERGAKALAQSESFPNLVSLNLPGNPIGPRGIRALAKDAKWPLRELNLYNCNADTSAIRALVRSPLMDSLQILDLGNDDLDTDALKAIAKAKRLSQLRQLWLFYTPFTLEGLLALAKSEPLQNLTTLSLGYSLYDPSPITGKEATEFIQELNLPHLRHFSMKALTVGTRGAKALMKSPCVESLTMLDLSSCRIGEQGGEALLETLDPQKIVKLDLWDNRFSEELVGRLRKRFGKSTRLG